MRPGCKCSKAEEINKSDIDMTERKKTLQVGKTSWAHDSQKLH